MDILSGLYQTLDPVLILPFRLPSDPLAGFAVGLFWVSLLATIVGELTMFGVYWINRRHFASMSGEMVSQHNLSLKALGAKDKKSWKACNAQANDAFGRTFFAGIALFAASLWPAFLVMGWLTFRFKAVAFDVPLAGEVGATFFLVPTYVITRILFHKAKPVLPLFRTMQRKVKENEGPEKLMTFADIVQVPDQDSDQDSGEGEGKPVEPGESS